MAYEKTEVTVSRSQEQIRTVLRRSGADRITFGEVLTGEHKSAGVEFVHLGLKVRVLCPLKEPPARTVTEKANRSRSKTRDDVLDEMLEQEAKRVWRVLHWGIKARMESVAEELETFEQAFLPHIVDPRTGQTLWTMMQPTIEAGALQVESGEGFGSFQRALEAGPT